MLYKCGCCLTEYKFVDIPLAFCPLCSDNAPAHKMEILKPVTGDWLDSYLDTLCVRAVKSGKDELMAQGVINSIRNTLTVFNRELYTMEKEQASENN